MTILTTTINETGMEAKMPEFVPSDSISTRGNSDRLLIVVLVFVMAIRVDLAGQIIESSVLERSRVGIAMASGGGPGLWFFGGE